MEKSNEELLTGIAKLERQSPFPDEIFYRIFEIEDNVERQKYIEALRNEAKILKRSTEFNNLLKRSSLTIFSGCARPATKRLLPISRRN